jgi:AbrB family looped-hinge helix DNA binding protein
MVTMIAEKMRVGPKGQVVIPSVFRKILKISPGSHVVFKLERDRVILETDIQDPIRVFETVSKKGKSISKVNPHAYEEELAARNP